MIRKSGIRLPEKIVLKQKARARCRSNHNSSRSSVTIAPKGDFLHQFTAFRVAETRLVFRNLSICGANTGTSNEFRGAKATDERSDFHSQQRLLDNLYHAMASISRTCAGLVIGRGLLRTKTFCMAPAAIAS